MCYMKVFSLAYHMPSCVKGNTSLTNESWPEVTEPSSYVFILFQTFLCNFSTQFRVPKVAKKTSSNI